MMISKGRFAFKAIAVLGLLGTAGSALAQDWTTQSDMKVARVEATTIDYRDNIYVLNGFKPGIRIAESVEKYDSATKQWSLVGTSSVGNGSAVTHNGAVRVGAEVWMIGGRIGSHPGVVSDKVWVYNLDNNKWRRGPDLPVPGAAGGAALVNNKIHWIGGIDPQASCDVARHLVYDLGNRSAGWKNITASAGMPTPRNHFSTAAVNGIIYVMGGQFGHDACPGKRTNDSALVHAFDPKNNKWSRKADMPKVNSHSEPGTFVYKSNIYTTGGEGAGDKVWKFNPRSNKWSTYKTLPESLVAPVARIVDGHLIVAGGGAPRAALATATVRSMLVDNNPPTQPNTQPVVVPEPVTPKPPEPGSNTPAGATLISMEAEYFDVSTSTATHQWVHVARGNSSNDDAMITTPDQGDLAGSTDNTPMLSYMVFFNHPGKHYIWVRGAGDTNAAGVGNSDSIHVGLNGKVASTAYRIDQFPADWTWSRHTPSNPVASLNVVNAGVNMVNFWMREDGLAIDKFVITSDPSFVPNGYGPELTDGTDGYVAPVADTDANIDNLDDVQQINNDAVEPEPTNVDPMNSGSTDDGLEVVDPAIDDLEKAVTNNNVDLNESETIDMNLGATNSSKGIFGGSASMFGLMVLFALCFLRRGR